VVALDALVELVRRKVVDQLGEDDAAGMHASLSVRPPPEPPQPQNSLTKVEIEKTLDPAYTHGHTGVTAPIGNDSRTVVMKHQAIASSETMYLPPIWKTSNTLRHFCLG